MSSRIKKAVRNTAHRSALGRVRERIDAETTPVRKAVASAAVEILRMRAQAALRLDPYEWAGDAERHNAWFLMMIRALPASDPDRVDAEPHIVNALHVTMGLPSSLAGKA